MTKEPRLWAIVLHNDDHTPMDYVVEILISIFRKTFEDACEITMDVHEKGRAIAGVYTREIAAMKIAKVREQNAITKHYFVATMEVNND